jgi:hypothetical protein
VARDRPARLVFLGAGDRLGAARLSEGREVTFGELVRRRGQSWRGVGAGVQKSRLAGVLGDWGVGGALPRAVVAVDQLAAGAERAVWLADAGGVGVSGFQKRRMAMAKESRDRSRACESAVVGAGAGRCVGGEFGHASAWNGCGGRGK